MCPVYYTLQLCVCACVKVQVYRCRWKHLRIYSSTTVYMQVYGCKCICAGESTYTSTTVYMIICRFVNDLLNTLYPLAAARCRSMPNKPTPSRTNRAWIIKNWCEIAIWFGLRQPFPYDVVWTRWTLPARNARRWSKTAIEKPIAIFLAQTCSQWTLKLKDRKTPNITFFQ